MQTGQEKHIVKDQGLVTIYGRLNIWLRPAHDQMGEYVKDLTLYSNRKAISNSVLANQLDIVKNIRYNRQK